MRQRTWMFADDDTGEFHPMTFSASTEDDAIANAPPGTIVVEGAFDHLSQRLDLGTGEIVEFQPPQPDPRHVWDAESKRWVLPVDAIEQQLAVISAQARIDELERKELRALREERSTDPAVAEEARRRLDDIALEIEAQRGIIQGRAPS